MFSCFSLNNVGMDGVRLTDILSFELLSGEKKKCIAANLCCQAVLLRVLLFIGCVVTMHAWQMPVLDGRAFVRGGMSDRCTVECICVWRFFFVSRKGTWGLC